MDSGESTPDNNDIRVPPPQQAVPSSFAISMSPPGTARPECWSERLPGSQGSLFAGSLASPGGDVPDPTNGCEP
ncbi:hypothetical protein GCM10010448_06160 [Streptomyces glomeratus]|uniref:Uncharacterized protein n=1 Tax=Streptomyces glomeratus TaxID=284452 RepID=A0ABP6KYE4_9ACTN